MTENEARETNRKEFIHEFIPSKKKKKKRM